MRRANFKPGALVRVVLFGSCSLTALLAGSVSSSLSQQAAKYEMSTEENPPTFQLKVERNLVVVRVIVRDSDGRVQGNLGKEDFTLLDNGKPQVISHFSVEKTSGERIPTSTTGGEKAEGGETGGTSATAPRHFLALYFDDVHLELQDIMRSRDAAESYLKKLLGPGDRAAIYTSSGQVGLDFTSDQEALHRTLQSLLPRPVGDLRADRDCPDIGDYQAYMIVMEKDPQALDVATQEGFECNCRQLRGAGRSPENDALLRQCRADQQRNAYNVAVQVLNQTEDNTEYSLRGVERIIRRMAVLPGQRTVILISPGFITASQRQHLNDVVDRALGSNVIVSTLDGRGLATDPAIATSEMNPVIPIERPDLANLKARILIQREFWTQDPMTTLAQDTGGVFFHNNNDLARGFLEAGTLPDVSYVLTYSPTNLKRDGRFHTITVKLAHGRGLEVQARRGYFAPSKTQDAAAEAKEELREILFSQEDVNELRADLRTQYFRMSQSQARLSIFTHVDVGSIHFEKENGLNLDNLTILLAIFDENGNIVVVKQKTVTFRLRDQTLDRLRKSGLTARTSFDVKPGNYLLRQVVRDGSSSIMSGLSRSVQITF